MLPCCQVCALSQSYTFNIKGDAFVGNRKDTNKLRRFYSEKKQVEILPGTVPLQDGYAA